MTTPPPPRPRPAPSHTVEFLGSFVRALPDPGLPEIAFAGRSNVGKSSLLNALVGQKKAARVSKTPGRTQALNLFVVDGRYVFVDLPGYGYAAVPASVQAAWKRAVEGYLGGRRALRLVVCLVDGRHEAQRIDQDLVAGLRDAGLPFQVVATKLDKVTRARRDAQRAQLARGLGLPTDAVLGLSSETGEGIDRLWACIRAAAAANAAPGSPP